ncbi:very short patch repair endonuclease [Legionella pneumophila]|uniref:very short patch repair endonuclease n=1 Tax=Legionella pneumophila TaxID=446 RepID=UPI000D7BD98A|nr:very short patch repair endonuclease [Legionella pneumophila]HAT9038858.1 DNA mismatch endonuclease Vsr [Legionella pneumophila subsp. pneumophila]MDF1930707.1 very short patch repair endonuclease [Legionella pneumophila]PYB43809.1 very short patch repair endonuclease [Legionella pneumophila]PYB49645.1 very short patch repair endonuclease [Legionella pneumophila]PYB62359.1 very short patch repair endonuclease [Legionella pneumophila]
MDTVDRKTRTKIMRSVPQKNTKPEIKLRKALHKLGFRYRLHDKNLPGTPDLVFPRYKAVVFVHGCFWHRHNCKQTTTPATHKEFWLTKFKINVARDRKNNQMLEDAGWRVMSVWECELKQTENIKLIKKVTESLLSNK